MSINVGYFMPANLGSISFSVGPLWMGLICTLLHFAGSRHNLTFPFALGTTLKLLHHSDVSSMPSRTTTCCHACPHYLWSLICSAVWAVKCLHCLCVKLSVICFVIYCLTHNSDNAKHFYIWHSEQFWAIASQYKESTLNTFIIVLYSY